jgi:hypothetical protein
MSVCLYSCFSYPPCKSHPFCAALYCHLWPAPLYIFPHYLTNGTIFGKKKLLNTECMFWFSLQLSSETFLTLRRIQRDIIIHVHTVGIHVKCPLFLSDFQKIIKFHKNPSSRSRAVACGQPWRSKEFLFAMLRTRLKSLQGLQIKLVHNLGSGVKE